MSAPPQPLVWPAGLTRKTVIEPDEMMQLDENVKDIGTLVGTITYGDYTPSFGAAGGLSGPFTKLYAYYTKIGNVVTVTFCITVTNTGSGSKTLNMTVPIAPTTTIANPEDAIGLCGHNGLATPTQGVVIGSTSVSNSVDAVWNDTLASGTTNIQGSYSYLTD